MISRVSMLILMQSNLDEAVKFYKDLGCQLKFHVPNSWAEFSIDGIKLGLCPTSQPQTEKRTGMVFEVDDLMGLYEKHKDTLPFLSEPLEKVHGIMVSVKDPGGNIIDLYQETPEKLKDLIKKVATQGDCCRQESCNCEHTAQYHAIKQVQEPLA